MKHLATVKFWPTQPSSKWVVPWRQGGKRQYRYFKDEKSAKEFAREKNDELRRDGNGHHELSIAERYAVLQAREDKFDLMAAVMHYRTYLATENSSVIVEIAIEEFLSIREKGTGAVHVCDLRSRLGKFAQSFGKRSVASITLSEVDGWLLGLACAQQTRLNYLKALRNFFTFCVEHSYCKTNVATNAQKVIVTPEEIGILSVNQARALLFSCEKALLPSVAIGMFAGLRRSEIRWLDWAGIDLDEKLITVTKSKTGNRRKPRFVKISENLAAWLAPHRAISGSVWPRNYRNLLEKTAVLAGIVPWPHNALRHSFASYHAAYYENTATTARQLGHSESVLAQHYDKRVKLEDARAFWQIFPQNCIKPLTLEAA